MTSVRFTVPGAPQGKARPRVVNQGGYTRAYTPGQTVKYEAEIRAAYQAVTSEKPHNGHIELLIKAYMPIPQSWPKSKKAAALAELIKPTVKPDGDNIAKAVMDALNGTAWLDDKQVTYLTVNKLYSVMPRLEIEVWSEEASV